MEVFLIKGDITEVECDAIVNPSNSYGYMGGGVALAIKKKGGEIIEKEAVEKAPIPVGKAVATTAGNLKAKYVIHASTMEKPAEKIGIDNVLKATEAALKLALELKIKCIAFPGMGTGVGGVKKEDAAEAMISVFERFKESDIKVVLVAFDEELYEAFRNALEKSSLSFNLSLATGSS